MALPFFQIRGAIVDSVKRVHFHLCGALLPSVFHVSALFLSCVLSTPQWAAGMLTTVETNYGPDVARSGGVTDLFLQENLQERAQDVPDLSLSQTAPRL
jgi:hypothetical protein